MDFDEDSGGIVLDEVVAQVAPTGEVGGLLTDLRLARRTVADHGDDLRWCHGLGRLVWTGKVWECDTTGEWDRRAKNAVLELYRDVADTEDDRARSNLREFAKKHETLQAFHNLCGI